MNPGIRSFGLNLFSLLLSTVAMACQATCGAAGAVPLAPVPFDVVAAVRAARAALAFPPVDGNEWHDMVDMLGDPCERLGNEHRLLFHAMVAARVLLTEEHVGPRETAGAWTALEVAAGVASPDALRAVQTARDVLAASPTPAGRAAIWHERLTDVLDDLCDEMAICLSSQRAIGAARFHLTGWRPQQALQELDSVGAAPVDSTDMQVD